jgi:hypothetical protein
VTAGRQTLRPTSVTHTPLPPVGEGDGAGAGWVVTGAGDGEDPGCGFGVGDGAPPPLPVAGAGFPDVLGRTAPGEPPEATRRVLGPGRRW